MVYAISRYGRCGKSEGNSCLDGGGRGGLGYPIVGWAGHLKAVTVGEDCPERTLVAGFQRRQVCFFQPLDALSLGLLYLLLGLVFLACWFMDECPVRPSRVLFTPNSIDSALLLSSYVHKYSFVSQTGFHGCVVCCRAYLQVYRQVMFVAVGIRVTGRS